MSNRRRVIVKQLPEDMCQQSAELFYGEMEPLVRTNRAHLVFDFSPVHEIDSAGLGVLLMCLEEVMKGNGDLKLAALPAQAEEIFALTGLYRLFEIFETTDQAVESFYSFRAEAVARMRQSQEPVVEIEMPAAPELRPAVPAMPVSASFMQPMEA